MKVLKYIGFLALLIVALLLYNPSTEAEAEFEIFANEFYAEMFSAGENSPKIEEMHKEMKSIHRSESDGKLYIALDKMYQALNNEDSATPYQLEVMRLLNR